VTSATAADHAAAERADERETARAATERWLRRHRLTRPEDRAALARHLDRAGFTAGVIAATLRAIDTRVE
jgi:hypothetical protein